MQQWYLEHGIHLNISSDDVTLPRQIRSPSAESVSTIAKGDTSTAASSLTRHSGRTLEVYQMPSFEDDNIIIFTNPEFESREDDSHEGW